MSYDMLLIVFAKQALKNLGYRIQFAQR